MKTVQKITPTPRPLKRKGRYASEREAVDTKRAEILAVLKDVDLKNLTLD